MPIPAGTESFDALAAALMRDELTAQPVLGTALGLTEYDDQLPDMTAAAITARERSEDAWSERFAALADEGLEPAEQVDRDLVLMALRGRALMRDWADWRRNPDAYSGPALSGVYSLLLHRLRPEPELAEAVAARLDDVPDLLAAGVANLEPELAGSVVVLRALGQVRAGPSYLRSVASEFADGSGRVRVARSGERAAEAFERFAEHVEVLAEHARGEWAIGEARYDGLLREAEGLSYGAREMRERGQAVYDELAEDMRRRTAELRGDPQDTDWRRLVAELAEDRPETPEEMLAGYTDATAAAQRFCADRELVTLPPGEECRVVPSAPFSRSMLAVAHYIPPPVFSDRRTGHFFVPYPPEDATAEQVAQRLATNHRATQWTISAHEAYPGHHWHLAWLAANGVRPLRSVFGSTYFVEGWGLYSEELMREQGFFADPRHELAQVDSRLFRAARIVIDTSLHLGEMSPEDAVEFLSTKASLSVDTARAEVARYCAWPTQAASYLTGALEVARMRDEWLRSGRGSLREFHDRAAGSGRLPIALVERSLTPPTPPPTTPP